LTTKLVVPQWTNDEQRQDSVPDERVGNTTQQHQQAGRDRPAGPINDHLLTSKTKETTMSATLTNGRPRKQLSDQLERLDEQLQRHDAILDALAEGLNGAVADATKEGTKEAVTAAVIELLTNVDLRAALHRASAPEGEAKPSAWVQLKAKVRQAAQKVHALATSVAAAVVARVAHMATTVRKFCSRVRQSVRARVAVQVLLGASALALGVRYYAARQFATAVGWVKGIAIELGDKISGWARVLVPASVT
jgi:hypothetical protein